MDIFETQTGAVSRWPLVTLALLLGCLTACAGPTGLPAPEEGTSTGQKTSGESKSGASPTVSVSAAARQVGGIAVKNGDLDFLVIDKPHGEVIVFEDGRPTFSGAALTGENPADRLPPDSYAKPFSELKDYKYKVTPAGRFTVTEGFDKNYGQTLDVNEIQGKDWDVAIHRVWLGAPAEHRDLRLKSGKGEDTHITYGCIDVAAGTMQQLLRRIPDKEETPLYIVPQDPSLLGRIFVPHGTAAKAPAATPPHSG